MKFKIVIHRYGLDEYGTARRTAVVRGFIDALTRGGRCFCTFDSTWVVFTKHLPKLGSILGFMTSPSLK